MALDKNTSLLPYLELTNRNSPEFEFSGTANAAGKASLISVTDLSAYLYCPRLLFKQRVLGIVEPPNLAMVLGSLRHSFYDGANKIEEKLVVSLPSFNKEELVAAYSDAYSNLLIQTINSFEKSLASFNVTPLDILPKLEPLANAEAMERSQNVFNFSEKHNIFGELLWEKLSPKILTEVRVRSTNLRLKGVIDRMEVFDDSIIPLELKTGKMPKDGVWPAHRVQVAAYIMLVREAFGKPVSKAVVRYLDSNVSRPVIFNSFMELEIKDLTNKVINMLASKIAPNPCGKETCPCTK